LVGLSVRPSPALAQTPDDGVIYLDQAWSQEDREMYYNISQGSAAVSYDVFLNLEVAGSEELFASDANSLRYGLVPQAPNPRTNPDGLPIGIARTVVEAGPQEGVMAGLTCAACHNAELNYQGQRIRVDGGVGNMFDLMAYFGALDDAMQETLADSAKFERLAARIGAADSELRTRFERDAAAIHQYVTRTIATPTHWGPSRLDAISAIVNRLTAIETDIPENHSTAMAPTKPPFLWNAPQGSWTQWRGSQQDPINRNLVESMGVYLPMDLTAASPAEGLFSSGAQILNLRTIEDALNRLAPPMWPEEIFGEIDREKAAAGETLFMENCAGCHNAWPYTWTEPNKYGKRFIEVGLVPDSYVGTDPGQFHDLKPYAITAQLAPYLPGVFKGREIIPTGDLYVILQRAILDAALAKIDMTEEEKIALHGYREFPLPRPTEGVYKAAPRDGVWATPPFLHNGSVPNLYEMLIPADERTKEFYVGREFDPVKVGLDTTSGVFLLDTSLSGNSNKGHSFEDGPRGDGIIGPLLTEDERWQLVEYLKSIPDEPGRVTPFGGPPDAITGHGVWSQ
jgi:mono/diheme cytochrome c family protein